MSASTHTIIQWCQRMIDDMCKRKLSPQPCSPTAFAFAQCASSPPTSNARRIGLAQRIYATTNCA
jgi:hypothetical protein